MRIYKDGETLTLTRTDTVMVIRDYNGIQGQKRRIYKDTHGNEWVQWYTKFYQFDRDRKVRRETEALKVY